MVSVPESISSSDQINKVSEMDNTGIKRKWQGGKEENFNLLSKISKVETRKPLFEIDFHLQRSLPLDWKQCLDIKSGEVQEKRTCKDPRKTPAPMSLDLELNLPYNWTKPVSDEPDSRLSLDSSPSPKKSESLSRCTSWMAFEEDHKEMVTAVCMRCNMLVMLCKSSPTCPNCKFVHPPEKNPICNFKPRLSLLPCKD
ncbi:hypothetical protein ACHQM5_023587 [Ranunculus cassubicifolius]